MSSLPASFRAASIFFSSSSSSETLAFASIMAESKFSNSVHVSSHEVSLRDHLREVNSNHNKNVNKSLSLRRTVCKSSLSLNGNGPVKALCLTITCLKFIGAQRSFLSYEFCGFGFLFILNLYLLLTEFEVRTVSYGPSFFPFDLWPKREARGP